MCSTVYRHIPRHPASKHFLPATPHLSSLFCSLIGRRKAINSGTDKCHKLTGGKKKEEQISITSFLTQMPLTAAFLTHIRVDKLLPAISYCGDPHVPTDLASFSIFRHQKNENKTNNQPPTIAK